MKPQWHNQVPEPEEGAVVVGEDADHDVSGKHGHRGFLPGEHHLCTNVFGRD